MWWHEEGKHVDEPDNVNDDDDAWRDEPVPHDDLGQCIAQGDMSTKGERNANGERLWRCDVCADAYVFVRDNNGDFFHYTETEA